MRIQANNSWINGLEAIPRFIFANFVVKLVPYTSANTITEYHEIRKS